MGERRRLKEAELTGEQWSTLIGWVREFRALCKERGLSDPGTISGWVKQYDIYAGIDKLSSVNSSLMYRALLALDVPALPANGKGLPT